MRILNRYVLRQIAVPALLAVTAVAVVGVASEIQERVKILPIAQMTLGDVSRLAFFFLPTLAAYILPATFLMGILLAFGRMAQNNEIVAMKAAGIPLKRIVAPVLVTGAILSGITFLIQDRLQPWAYAKADDLIHSEIPLRATIDALTTGVMHDFAGWRVYIGKKNAREGLLENIVILKPEESGRATAYYATSARLVRENSQATLEMRDGHFIPPGENGQVTRLTFNTTRLAVPMPKTTWQSPGQVPRLEQNLAQLWAGEREYRRQIAETGSEPLQLELAKQRREMADRLSMPFACLAVTLAAAPLGARAQRSGRSYTFGIGFAIIFLYYVLQMLMEPKALYGLTTMILRAWTPNLVLAAAGIVFLWRVDRV